MKSIYRNGLALLLIVFFAAGLSACGGDPQPVWKQATAQLLNVEMNNQGNIAASHFYEYWGGSDSFALYSTAGQLLSQTTYPELTNAEVNAKTEDQNNSTIIAGIKANPDNTNNIYVKKYSASGQLLQDFSATGNTPSDQLRGMSMGVDNAGNIWLAYNKLEGTPVIISAHMLKITPNNTIEQDIYFPNRVIKILAVNAQGQVAIADTDQSTQKNIQLFSENGDAIAGHPITEFANGFSNFNAEGKALNNGDFMLLASLQSTAATQVNVLKLTTAGALAYSTPLNGLKKLPSTPQLTLDETGNLITAAACAFDVCTDASTPYRAIVIAINSANGLPLWTYIANTPKSIFAVPISLSGQTPIPGQMSFANQYLRKLVAVNGQIWLGLHSDTGINSTTSLPTSYPSEQNDIISINPQTLTKVRQLSFTKTGLFDFTITPNNEIVISGTANNSPQYIALFK